jgi:SAM-dependent methyltransferase
MYTCNITGKKFNLIEEEKNREGGLVFGYNCRFRAISYLFTKMLYQEVKILSKVPINKKIRGIGMRDSSWSTICEEKYDYVNTFSDKETKLDIYDKADVDKFDNLDFIISSDVFQFLSPYPNIQIAFNNLYKMLKPSGFLVFSVPFVYGEHQEYYPNLYDYKIVKHDDENVLVNTTRDGEHEVYNNLKFSGGGGKDLEMRMFTKKSLIKYLCDANFTDIEFHEPDEEMNKYGIFWENSCSLIITARK